MEDVKYGLRHKPTGQLLRYSIGEEGRDTFQDFSFHGEFIYEVASEKEAYKTKLRGKGIDLPYRRETSKLLEDCEVVKLEKTINISPCTESPYANAVCIEKIGGRLSARGKFVMTEQDESSLPEVGSIIFSQEWAAFYRLTGYSKKKNLYVMECEYL